MAGVNQQIVYTHHFHVKDWRDPGWRAIWPQLIDDARLIMEACDVILTGPSQSSSTGITPPIATVNEGIIFNGVGEYGHETFQLCEGSDRDSVGTARKPYDVAVCCVLLRAYVLCPTQIMVDPDGRWGDELWSPVRDLYQILWQGENLGCPSWWNPKDLRLLPKDCSFNDNSDAGPTQTDSPITNKQQSFGPSKCSSASRINSTAIKAWLHHCETSPEHRHCQPISLGWQVFNGVQFRLIDVRRRCVVDGPKTCNFVALTYVWGGVHQPKLTTANIEDLSQNHGLDLIWEQIPTTIKDAILLCERLEERYLWVDALCILQDSSRDMRLQILRMRRIYSAAKFTIAAVSSLNANKGLQPPTPAGTSAVCSSVEGFHSMLEASPWGSRGWCFQERVLSHRSIFFTSSGIFLQCQEGITHIDGSLLQAHKTKLEPHSSQSVGGLLHVPSGKGLEYFVSAVEYYSNCRFTNSADKISAFQAVFQRFEGMMDGQQSIFHYGMPTSAFDQAVCWRTELHRPQLRNPHFPSWSWLGWDCGVLFDRKLLSGARTNQMAGGGFIGTPWSQVRKPLTRQSLSRFGFPTSFSSSFYNIPFLSLLASTADLFISDNFERDMGSNALYAVFPAHCSRLSLPLVSPRLLAKSKQTVLQYDNRRHDNHGTCEAKQPLGCIWLDRAWRESQPKKCLMEFMALDGYPNPDGGDTWVITMLMCLLGSDGLGRFGRNERFQLMDCFIPETQWLRIGGMTNFITLH